MKKYLVFLFAILALTCHAQLRVNNYGNVNIGDSVLFPNCHLTIKEISANLSLFNSISSSKIGVASFSHPDSNYNFGIVGSCMNTNSYQSGLRKFGVYGLAGDTHFNGYNYGVFGGLIAQGNGAAVYGTTANLLGVSVSGKYAGFFEGDAYVTGTATVTNLLQPSDERLKDEISYLSETGKDWDFHQRMMDVSVISYKYKPYFYTEEDPAEMEKYGTADDRIHYGVSAQQLKELFPELVVEGQDGYLAVNYQELIPMLICSVQQLQKELDALKKEGRIKTAAYNDNLTAVSMDPPAENSILYQNTPNPFTGTTVIRFELPEEVSDAYIFIFNMQGTMLSQIPVRGTTDRITINGYDYGPGMYIYSLIVNGRKVDSKRMILTK